MKKIIFFVVSLLSLNAMAISFFTEADVGEKLEAQKVIEVSKYSVESLVKNTPCEDSFFSRSARAYIVKKNEKSALYLTSESLHALTKCLDL